MLGTILDVGGAGSVEVQRTDRPEPSAADRDAVRRLAGGDRDALLKLYDCHGRAVYSLALRIVTDDGEAQDVVQEVFAQAWKQAERYDRARGSVATWLLTITRSRAIDRLRARRKRPDAGRVAADVATLDVPDLARGHEHTVLTDEAMTRLRAALADLPMLQRAAIELAYYEGLTRSEIAARLEEPLGTATTRIRTGLMKLRDALAENAS